jgi:hypothetical protein
MSFNVDFLTAVSIAISAWLGGIVLLWLLHSAAVRKGKEGMLDPRFVWVCGVCTYNYVNTRDEAITVCPRCGNFNKK